MRIYKNKMNHPFFFANNLEKTSIPYSLVNPIMPLTPSQQTISPKQKKCQAKKTLDTFGRKEETRTPDPYVPNVVRYQLRYFPIVAKDNAKLKVFIVTHNSFVQKVPLEQ